MFVTFVQTLSKSVALGSIYAIMGLSFVLIFKGTQVLNFAAGAISMAGALFMSIMIADGGFPFSYGVVYALLSALGCILVYQGINGGKMSHLGGGAVVLLFTIGLMVGVGDVGSPVPNPLAPESGETASIPLWILHLIMALILAGVMGLVLERVAIRPMVGQPLFAMAVITLGLEIAIRPFNLDATAITGRSIGVPWGSEVWNIGDAIFPKSYLAAMIAAAIAFAFVFWFYRSRFGVAMRAVAFDQEAAMAQGINVGRVFAIAWALGAALATLAAIMFAMAPWPPAGVVSLEIHPVWVFRVLPVIVLGGLDSVTGVIYGGMIIAACEIFAGQYLSQWTSILGPGYSTIVPYLVMLVVLLIRPYGLFGTPEIRRV